MLSILEKHVGKYSKNPIRMATNTEGMACKRHIKRTSNNTYVQELDASNMIGDSPSPVVADISPPCDGAGAFSSPIALGLHRDRSAANKTPGLDEMDISSATKRIIKYNKGAGQKLRTKETLDIQHLGNESGNQSTGDIRNDADIGSSPTEFLSTPPLSKALHFQFGKIFLVFFVMSYTTNSRCEQKVRSRPLASSLQALLPPPAHLLHNWMVR